MYSSTKELAKPFLSLLHVIPPGCDEGNPHHFMGTVRSEDASQLGTRRRQRELSKWEKVCNGSMKGKGDAVGWMPVSVFSIKIPRSLLHSTCQATLHNMPSWPLSFLITHKKNTAENPSTGQQGTLAKTGLEGSLGDAAPTCQIKRGNKHAKPNPSHMLWGLPSYEKTYPLPQAWRQKRARAYPSSAFFFTRVHGLGNSSLYENPSSLDRGKLLLPLQLLSSMHQYNVSRNFSRSDGAAQRMSIFVRLDSSDSHLSQMSGDPWLKCSSRSSTCTTCESTSQ